MEEKEKNQIEEKNPSNDIKDNLESIRDFSKFELSGNYYNEKQLLSNNSSERMAAMNSLGLVNESMRKYHETQGIQIEREQAEDEYGGDIYYSDEIKVLCMKYNLRLLHTSYYKANIIGELLDAIIKFSNSNKVRIGTGGDTWSGDKDKFYILAPKKDFKRGIKTIQPMVFYKINDKNRNDTNVFYKLVYFSWTKLSLMKYILSWHKRSFTNNFIHITSIASIFMFFLAGKFIFNPIYAMLFALGTSAVIAFFCNLAVIYDNGESPNFEDSIYFSDGGWNSIK